jgi:hypothetical protein
MIRKLTTKMLALLIASALALPKVAAPQAIAVLPSTFEFYEHEEFQGESIQYPVNIGFSSFPDDYQYACTNILEFNDKATSVKWGPQSGIDPPSYFKAEICFYEGVDCSGGGRCYSYSARQDPNIARWGFNDVISSFSTTGFPTSN